MFIDIHTHCYRITPPMYQFCTPEDWYDGEMLDWIRECRKG